MRESGLLTSSHDTKSIKKLQKVVMYMWGMCTEIITNLLGGLQHDWILTFHSVGNVMSSQLTFTPWFFRGVGWNHQPEILGASRRRVRWRFSGDLTPTFGARKSASSGLGWWSHSFSGWTTLWLFNITMENGPFIDDFPIKTFIYKGFSMAMLNNQMIIGQAIV